MTEKNKVLVLGKISPKTLEKLAQHAKAEKLSIHASTNRIEFLDALEKNPDLAHSVIAMISSDIGYNDYRAVAAHLPVLDNYFSDNSSSELLTMIFDRVTEEKLPTIIQFFRGLREKN